MKKIKKIFIAVLTAVIMCLSLLTACAKPADEAVKVADVIEAIKGLKAVATSFSEKIETTETIAGKTQQSGIELTGLANSHSKTADIFYKQTLTQGSLSENSIVDIYCRENSTFVTDAYSELDSEEANVLRVEGNLDLALNSLGIDLDASSLFEQSDNSSLIAAIEFAQNYNSIDTDANSLTINGNKLIYNLAKEFVSVFENIDDKTTVGDLLAEEKVKKFINNFDSQEAVEYLHYYLVITFGSGAPIDGINPQEGQSLYDYIVQLSRSGDLVNKTILASLFGPDKAVASYNVYEVLNTLTGDAEEFLVEFINALKEVEKDTCEIEINISETQTATIAVKNLVVVINLEAGEICGANVTGQISGEAIIDGEVEGINISIEAFTEYFKEEQKLTDLSEFSFLVQKAYFYDRTFTTTPLQIYPESENFEAVIVPVNGVVDEFYFYNGNKTVTPEYDAEENVYKYTQNGYTMYVKISTTEINVYYDETDEHFSRAYIWNPGAYFKEELLTYEELIKNEQNVF